MSVYSLLTLCLPHAALSAVCPCLKEQPLTIPELFLRYEITKTGGNEDIKLSNLS